MADRTAASPSKHLASYRPRLRSGLLAIVGLLYVFSIPWYRSADAPLRIWLGLPDWVAVALGCYVLAAVLIAWAWWITDIPDALPEPAPEPALEREATSVAAHGESAR